MAAITFNISAPSPSTAHKIKQLPTILSPNFSTTSLHFPKTLSPNFNFNYITLPHLRSLISISAVASSSPSISTPTLKTRLRNGETLYGLFLLSFSPTLAEIAGLSGYDFVVVDMEHGHGGISDALPCLHALAATSTPAIIRIPESSPTWAKKALDLGPQGIMFPMIETAKMAKKAVSYCRFPPNGIRGSAHSVVRASGYGIDSGYLSNYEEELLIMCQVECEEAVKNVEDIAEVEGVDCIQMGPLDMSASMGYLWDPGHKKVKEVMRIVEKAVLKTTTNKKKGAYLCGFAMPHDSPDELRKRGYHMVSGAVDIGLFRAAAVEDVGKFKSGLVVDDHDDGGGGKKNGKNGGEEEYWSE